ncbi:MAG: RagB/SusD family nutrient uptake outer membrane protein [Chitinophagaceae bacterium]|nr:RagB/SusD family nutrient uptake outer membrane protein [Chitinophagaceae bacterium]
MRSIYRTGIIIAAMAMLMTTPGCKKLVDPDAAQEKIGEETVYSNDKTAAAVTTRLLAEMAFVSESTNGFPINMALAADDLKVASYVANSTQQLYFNTNMSDGTFWWSYLYNYVYYTNDVIEHLSSSTAVSETVRKYLMGEAYFVRAFCYFYLVNTYGDVPLVLSTDWTKTQNMGRTPSDQVWAQIKSDLKDAKDLLSKEYLHSNMTPTTLGDRYRPNKAVAAALLARVCLYTKDYVNAEKEATEVINNPAYSFIDLNNVFLKNSKETIWQLPAMTPGVNSLDGSSFILRKINPSDPQGPNSTTPFLASDNLLDAFEPGDLRATKWIGDSAGYKFINKYKYPFVDATKANVEAIMMMRLGEQYLIRAEARIKSGHVPDGIADLNALRTRARGNNAGDLPNLDPGMGQPAAELAVEHERQVELFTEWGHRWFDLKRTNRLDAVMTIATPLKNGNISQWQSFHALFPLPAGEVANAPGLRGHQNPGYPQN